MKAILKDIEVTDYDESMLRHPITMFFVESEESDELYRFGTTVEMQFCANDEYDGKEGITEKIFDEKVRFAKTLIGKSFEINLYKFTVKELTDNKYAALEFSTYYYDDFYDEETVEDYHIASFMAKEDVILI